MSDIALDIRGVSKMYRLGARGRMTIRGIRGLIKSVSSPSATDDEKVLWALNDVHARIQQGQVVGIIGRNGSGKSTLLKILSQVTTPTSGEVEIFGRLGSLLEVGTGFHPELTGRENIYLNGTLLGMSRHEISRKVDAIVQFAEVEKFLDTPVKRYSSGMYVRLAFSVAAHLETDILVLDEVLAVGDLGFQKNCLTKVGEVARSGRTILIVSHNMSVIQGACSHGMLLNEGKCLAYGAIEPIVKQYIQMGLSASGERIWDEAKAPKFEDGSVIMRAVRAVSVDDKITGTHDVSDPIRIEIDYEIMESKHIASLHVYFRSDYGQTIFVSMDNPFSPWKGSPQPVGLHRARCIVPAGLLSHGSYRIETLICTNPTSTYYCTETDAMILVVDDRLDDSPVRGDWNREWPASLVRPLLKWEFEQLSGGGGGPRHG